MLLSARSDTELLWSTSKLFPVYMIDDEPHNIELAQLLGEMTTNALSLTNPTLLDSPHAHGLPLHSDSVATSMTGAMDTEFGSVSSEPSDPDPVHPNPSTPLGFYLDLPLDEALPDMMHRLPQDL